MDKRDKPTKKASRALKRLEAHLISPNNEESRGHVGHSSTENSPVDKNAGSAARRSVRESEDRRRSRSPSRRSKSSGRERGDRSRSSRRSGGKKIHVKRVEAVRVLGQEVLEGNVRTGRIRRPGNRQRGRKNCFANNGKTQMI